MYRTKSNMKRNVKTITIIFNGSQEILNRLCTTPSFVSIFRRVAGFPKLTIGVRYEYRANHTEIGWFTDRGSMFDCSDLLSNDRYFFIEYRNL